MLALTEMGDCEPATLVNYLLSTLGEYGPEVLSAQCSPRRTSRTNFLRTYMARCELDLLL